MVREGHKGFVTQKGSLSWDWLKPKSIPNNSSKPKDLVCCTFFFFNELYEMLSDENVEREYTKLFLLESYLNTYC